MMINGQRESLEAGAFYIGLCRKNEQTMERGGGSRWARSLVQEGQCSGQTDRTPVV